MCWLLCKEKRSHIALHLRGYLYESWKVYTAPPHAVPDHKLSGGSKGWATFQKLRQTGWTLNSSDCSNLSALLVTVSHQHN